MRYKIIIEYDGTPFVGWQRQDNGLSVQECIETAIESLFQEKPTLFGAGRTDSGVHATGQVAHFDITTKELDTYSIKTGLNHYLKIYPISILDVTEVDADFHSRFDATERKYLYRIINRTSPLSIEKGRAWLVMKDLNLEKYCNLYANCSRNVEDAENFSKKYNFLKYYGSYEELIGDKKIDFIINII